jgi:hypothetical protein
MSKVKLVQLIVAAVPVLAVITLPLRGADDIPKRPNFDRYAVMLKNSPFAVATAVVAPAPTPTIFKDLYIANAAHTDQADFVTVISASDKNMREYLSTEKPNEHGFAISNIQWSDKLGETKVTVTKDGQFGTLGFNQSLMTSPGGNGAVPMNPVIPAPISAIPTPFQPNMVKQPQYPGVITPTPHVRPIIQRNPAALPQMTPNMTPMQQEE